MRGILQFVAIVVVMVAARYAPLGDMARWLINPSAPAPIVTGSLQDGQPVAGAMDAPVRPVRDAATDVRTILAQASSEKGPRSNTQNQRTPAQRRGREDETQDDGEIYIGGTGLLEEGEVAVSNHPLASKYPDDYLVICEAGCRPASDRIVYKVSKIAAAAAAQAQRKMEVTSADGNTGNDNNEVVCIAGCYDEEPASRRRAAAAPERATVQLASVDTPSSEIAVQHDEPVIGEEAAVVTKAEVVEAPAPESVRQPHAAADAVQPETPAAAAASAPVVPTVAMVANVKTSAAEDNTPVQSQTAVTPARAAAHVAAASSSAAAPVEAAKVSDIAAIHAISAETAARREAKRTALAAPKATPAWETKVTSLVVLKKPTPPQRSVVALHTVAPFETSVSVEHGWDFTLSNTP